MNWATIIPPALRQSAQRFWSWWSAELLALLPPGVRERLSRGRQRLVVEVSDSSLPKDRELKRALYAEAGIPEEWVVG